MMNPKDSLLLSTATRKLGGNEEQKAAATQFLTELLVKDAREDDEAIKRWNEVDAKKWPDYPKIALFLLLIIIGALALIRIVPEGIFTTRYFIYLKNVYSFHFTEYVPYQNGKDLNLDQQLLLHLGSPTSSPLESAKKLWDRHPAEPKYFAHYVREYISVNKDAPPDLLKTARKIDPQNSWFTYVAASQMSQETVTRKSDDPATTSNSETNRQWEFVDEPRAKAALDLFHQARSQTEWNSYQIAIAQEKRQALKTDSFLHQLDSASILILGTEKNPISYHLAQLIAARSSALAEKMNREELLSLIEDHSVYLNRQLNCEHVSLFSNILIRFNIITLFDQFSKDLEKFGLERESEYYQKIFNNLKSSRIRSETEDAKVGSFNYADKGFTLSAMSVRSINGFSNVQLEFEDSEVRPERWMEHDKISMYSATILASIFGLAAIAMHLDQLRRNRICYLLSGRFSALFTTRDWCWIVAGGIGTPFILTLAAIYFTPLGGRDFSVGYWNFLIPVWYYIVLLLLVLILPVLVIPYRRGCRMFDFEFTSNHPWFGWIAVVAAIASIGTFPFLLHHPSISKLHLAGHPMSEWDFLVMDSSAPASIEIPYITLALAAIPLLWIIASILGSLLKSPRQSLAGCITARMLVPTYATASLTFFLLALLLEHTSEKHWRNSKIGETNPAAPHLSSVEYKVALEARQKFKNLLQAPR